MHSDDSGSYIDYDGDDVKRPFPDERLERLEHDTIPPSQIGLAVTYDDNYYVPKAGRTVRQVLRDHRKYLGPGIMASTAYFDPGNWVSDLSAGTEFRFALLTVILIAGIFAIVLQILSCRLGMCTGLDLAQHNRLLFYDRPRFKLAISGIGEVAILLTDIAELLGVAVAINALFPAISLPICVVLTISDVFIVWLANRGRGGAQTIKPHGLFLGSMQSSVASIEETNQANEAKDVEQPLPPNIISEQGRFNMLSALGTTRAPLSIIQHSLPHATWDVGLSLALCAIPINTAILVIAGQAFFGKDGAPADLFDAINLVTGLVGKIPGVIFTIALFANGELVGFLQKKINPVARRLVSRSIAIIPCAIVAGAGGREGVNSLILLSQVGLSLLLPFVTLPLVYATSTKKIMRVWDEDHKGWVDFASGWALCLAAYAIFSIVVIADVYTLVS
ncbi:hypothetical protein RQP46_010337 [Phenoliferia psychrophenolica]